MSLPYFPLYPSDFEAKTSHLTLEEDGAYNRLLRLSWMTPGCSLPDDPAWIARRMRVDMATFERVVAPLINEFFTRSRGRVAQKKLTEIFNETNEKHSRRVDAGKKGGRPPKALKINETIQSNAKAMPKQPEPEPDIEKREAKASPKKTRGSRLSPDWFLPLEWGEWALSQGMPASVIHTEADKFKDYWNARAGPNGVKLDWQATWRNWIRQAKERGHGNGNSKQITHSPKRPDPALEQIVRLAGLGQTPRDGRGGVGGSSEEDGSLWMGARPQ